MLAVSGVNSASCGLTQLVSSSWRKFISRAARGQVGQWLRTADVFADVMLLIHTICKLEGVWFEGPKLSNTTLVKSSMISFIRSVCYGISGRPE